MVRRMTGCDPGQAVQVVNALAEVLSLTPDPAAPPTGQFILAVVHLERRVIVDYMDFFLPIDDVRTCIGRPPQIDDEGILSWGNVTPDEATALIDIDEPEIHDATLREFADLMARHASTPIALSLYCSRRLR